MIELTSWSLVDGDEKFVVNKNSKLRLAGFVSNDPRFKNNSYIITSEIISSDGRSFVTSSGTHYYVLGAPEEAWVIFCEINGWKINPENVFENNLSHKNI